jgi:hypothetical protein
VTVTQVHAAFTATLRFGYATVWSTQDFLAMPRGLRPGGQTPSRVSPRPLCSYVRMIPDVYPHGNSPSFLKMIDRQQTGFNRLSKVNYLYNF